ncbi:hypothetical protein MU0083_003588 [[Mycobacterium] kokjensenii]|uniref:Uncharacterized protein n=1 Tax=[Mycobacterium] kokjensenii TaxID=3064287 RepID=A0ABN9NEJ4_9MYCO|nr:hypothetical protein [Mycolicibacter sp. MU0083]CAJ1505033.1 hypothetical protein MU0083_003588 [Mycolicibacter sp. MU0083]
MDFAMRYDRWYRPLATVVGLGPARASIRVADGLLQVRSGWAFAIEIPLDYVESARPAPERMWGWGVHQACNGWLVNGSRHGVVEIRLTHGVKPSKAPTAGIFNKPVRCLYVSVTDPDTFIAAATSSRLPATGS